MQSFLASVDLFRALPPALIAALAAAGERRRFRAGEQLMCAGDAARCLHVIVAGRVCVARRHVERGDESILLECGPGDVVGELGVLDGHPRPDTVTALLETETVELTREALARAIAAAPQEATSLLEALQRWPDGATPTARGP